MLELPFQVHDMLEQFRDGEIDVRVHLRGLEVLMGKFDVLFNRLVIAIVMVGTLIGAALIGVGVHGGPYVLGVQLLVWIGIGSAASWASSWWCRSSAAAGSDHLIRSGPRRPTPVLAWDHGRNDPPMADRTL